VREAESGRIRGVLEDLAAPSDLHDETGLVRPPGSCGDQIASTAAKPPTALSCSAPGSLAVAFWNSIWSLKAKPRPKSPNTRSRNIS
jgi:hypothetical protein